MILGGPDDGRQSLGKRLHNLRVVPSPAADDDLARRLAHHLDPEPHGLRHEGDKGGGGVFQFAGLEQIQREVKTVERLGRRGSEIGMRQQRAQHTFVDAADAGVPAEIIETACAPGLHHKVDHPVSGTSVESRDLAVVGNEGDVGDAADVEHGERRRET